MISFMFERAHRIHGNACDTVQHKTKYFLVKLNQPEFNVWAVS